jgi:hypothetical protein
MNIQLLQARRRVGDLIIIDMAAIVGPPLTSLPLQHVRCFSVIFGEPNTITEVRSIGPRTRDFFDVRDPALRAEILRLAHELLGGMP